MASLSEKLRRERELRGISLKQISEDTKIGVRFLEALEEDRLELIPGEFYRRSYLRAYARYLGLDEDRAINAYAYAHQEQRSDEIEEEEESSGRAVPVWLPWVIVVAALVLVGMFLSRPNADSDSRPGDATPHGDANPSAASTNIADARTADDAPPQIPASESALMSRTVSPPSPDVPILAPSGSDVPSEEELRLEVAVGEACWLEIEADGEVVTTGLKEEGFRRQVTAKEQVRLWIGNAGGVSFWVNDLPLRSLGRPGQVRKDLLITPDNFMNYVKVERASEPDPS